MHSERAYMEISSKAVVSLEVTGEKHSYRFTMPIGAPFQEAYDAAVKIVQEIVTFAENAAAQEKAMKEQQAEQAQATAQ